MVSIRELKLKRDHDGLFAQVSCHSVTLGRFKSDAQI